MFSKSHQVRVATYLVIESFFREPKGSDSHAVNLLQEARDTRFPISVMCFHLRNKRHMPARARLLYSIYRFCSYLFHACSAHLTGLERWAGGTRKDARA